MLPDIYCLRRGSSSDKALLFKLLNLAYQELFPQQSDFSHLSNTVDRYFSAKTPLWWVRMQESSPETSPIAGLWVGNAIDQVIGDRYTHIFLLYVKPAYRRQGIATALLEKAQTWAINRGDRQIGLQVFGNNKPALSLYQGLGFQPQSFFMLKEL
ncbi:MAG: GNAT family N-acetyltransferase [Microcystaceae cyanobacterium]